MVLELTLSELYTELETDPDLRRLGKYKVIAEERQTILPIEVNLPGKIIHLGEGDFTDGFVAFCKTTALGLDFGKTSFRDLYLDELNVDTISFSESRASRLYFDYAKINECHFDSFKAPEVYFDSAKITTIHNENLHAEIIYIEKLNTENFAIESLRVNAYRLNFATSETDTRITDSNNESIPDQETRILSKAEFLSLLAENSDLRRLGKYKVIAEDEDNLEINFNLEGKLINFGSGDFSDFRVSLGLTSAEMIDFSKSKFGLLEFSNAKFRNCFLDESQAERISFGGAEIKNIFCENGRINSINLDNLVCEQININSLVSSEFRMGECRIIEMYLSRGAGVERMYGERARLDILNLHEGKLLELDFGESTIRKTLLNKASIGVVECEKLKTDLLYIDNYENEIGELRLGMHPDIKAIELEKTLQPWIDSKEGERISPEDEHVVIKGIRFNP